MPHGDLSHCAVRQATARNAHLSDVSWPRPAIVKERAWRPKQKVPDAVEDIATIPRFVPLQHVSVAGDDDAGAGVDQSSCTAPLLGRRHWYEFIGTPVKMNEHSIRIRGQ